MCGRFALSAKTKDIQKLAPIKPSYLIDELDYNIAPGTNILGITNSENEYLPDKFYWGLIPFGNDMKFSIINAKSETLNEKSSFKKLVNSNRVLIPASGFYEWAKAGKTKIPYYFGLSNYNLFSFAGLYNTIRTDEGNILKTITIITCEANELMLKVHNRMPVIIDETLSREYLNPINKINEFLLPYPSENMLLREVSSFVNNPRNNAIACTKGLFDE